MAREQRRLAAIVAADVVGYSRLMGRDESGTVARLRKNRAERLEWEAGVAIDYAIASVEQAKLAVLDAVAGRAEAEKTKAS